MAAQRVASEQDQVGRQDQRPHADAETALEPHRLPHIVREDGQEEQRRVEEVAVHVLQDERQRGLAAVALARLADRAGVRVGPERFVVRAAVVVAGEAESTRRTEYEYGRGGEQPG